MRANDCVQTAAAALPCPGDPPGSAGAARADQGARGARRPRAGRRSPPSAAGAHALLLPRCPGTAVRCGARGWGRNPGPTPLAFAPSGSGRVGPGIRALRLFRLLWLPEHPGLCRRSEVDCPAPRAAGCGGGRGTRKGRTWSSPAMLGQAHSTTEKATSANPLIGSMRGQACLV